MGFASPAPLLGVVNALLPVACGRVCDATAASRVATTCPPLRVGSSHVTSTYRAVQPRSLTGFLERVSLVHAGEHHSNVDAREPDGVRPLPSAYFLHCEGADGLVVLALASRDLDARLLLIHVRALEGPVFATSWARAYYGAYPSSTSFLLAHTFGTAFSSTSPHLDAPAVSVIGVLIGIPASKSTRGACRCRGSWFRGLLEASAESEHVIILPCFKDFFIRVVVPLGGSLTVSPLTAVAVLNRPLVHSGRRFTHEVRISSGALALPVTVLRLLGSTSQCTGAASPPAPL